jgi:hypothetical protein
MSMSQTFFFIVNKMRLPLPRPVQVRHDSAGPVCSVCITLSLLTLCMRSFCLSERNHPQIGKVEVARDVKAIVNPVILIKCLFLSICHAIFHRKNVLYSTGLKYLVEFVFVFGYLIVKLLVSSEI